MVRDPKPERRGVSRRGFLVGAGVSAAAATAVSLAGCSSSSDDTAATGKPQSSVDDSQITNVIDAYESADDPGLTATATWSLPLGTVLFHTEGSWAAAMLTPESAVVSNSLGALSLSSGDVVTLIDSPTQGDACCFFDVRLGSGAFAWVEMDATTRSWILFGQTFSAGQLSGSPTELDHGGKNWEPPQFTVSGSTVIWQKMPLATGTKTAEDSTCYLWNVGDDRGTGIYVSTGRFATHPHVSDGVLTIAPRVNNNEGVFYGMTALDLSDGGKTMVDQLVLPETVVPFDAVYMGGLFAFSIEANYETGGSLGKMGTFIGREGGTYVFLSREPLSCVAGKGSRYLVKAQSSHFVIDTDAQTYGILTAPSGTLEYGDYPATEGTCDSFLTFATVRGDNAIPSAVTARLFNL